MLKSFQSAVRAIRYGASNGEYYTPLFIKFQSAVRAIRYGEVTEVLEEKQHSCFNPLCVQLDMVGMIQKSSHQDSQVSIRCACN